jgi:hypothetical protein
VSVEQIHADIRAARTSAENEDLETAALDAELAGYGSRDDGPVMPSTPPSVDEVRAGFARIATKLTSS